MKNTGIIRRIDDLGRIVIPKEIRSHLNIHEGDPLEIYLDGDKVCFKKYSCLESTFCEYSQLVCESIHDTTLYDVAIVNDCKVIECKCRVDIKNRLISNELQNCILHPNITVGQESSKYEAIYVTQDSNIKVILACPIVDSDKDIIGAIVVLDTPKLPSVSDSMIKVVESHARLFSYKSKC